MIVIDAIWEDFLKIAKQEVGVRVVETWIKAVTLYRYDPEKGMVYLKVPNAFVKDWVQTHYLSLFSTHLSRLFNIPSLQIYFSIDSGEDEIVIIDEKPENKIIPARQVGSKDKQEGSKIRLHRQVDHGTLNPSYTFDTFVVGQNNSFAYAAARAVVEKLGKLYNPLLFYGPSGLGKTHLLHAIGNEVLSKEPHKSILYQSTDRFINEFIHAIRFDKVSMFQQKYRSVDVLLLDDVQFMAKKEQTQEAFFHIFNTLYEEHKQIVFTSDVLPRQLGGFAQRLSSRLEWGLVADLQAPLLETKIAILKRKASMQHEELSDEAATFIAHRSYTNVRELEGALIRVLAFASLTGYPVTIDVIKKVLGQEEPVSSVRTELQDIVKVIQKKYAYKLDDLRSKDRSKDISMVRQIAMYLMKKKTYKSLREIGEFLDRKDHTTITYALDKIEEMRSHNADFDQELTQLERELELV